MSQTRIEYFNPEQHGSLDIASLHLQVRTWQESAGQNNFPDISDTQAELHDIQASYLAGGGNFFLALSEKDDIQGFVGLMRKNDAGIVKRMAVLPEFQRRGIGSMLMSELVSWARSTDMVRLRLATGVDEQAIHIYQQVGFSIVDFNKGSQDHLLELTLT